MAHTPNPRDNPKMYEFFASAAMLTGVGLALVAGSAAGTYWGWQFAVGVALSTVAPFSMVLMVPCAWIVNKLYKEPLP